MLVLYPFKAYLWGCWVRVNLLLQDWVTQKIGWSKWISFAIFLCTFVFVDTILAFRDMAIENMRNWAAYAIWNSPQVIDHAVFKYRVLWGLAMFYGDIAQSENSSLNRSEQQEVAGRFWRYDAPADAKWILYLIWFLGIIPITLMTYYVYEPQLLERWRVRMWYEVTQFVGVDYVGSRHPSILAKKIDNAHRRKGAQEDGGDGPGIELTEKSLSSDQALLEKSREENEIS